VLYARGIKWENITKQQNKTTIRKTSLVTQKLAAKLGI
jgi:hypothetical protein